MSSYGSEAGAWDGGPPGAEAEYATQRAPPAAAPMPTTDPWTGVSYSHYGPPQYDYQAYGAHAYGYNYDSSYYQASDGAYYDARSAYPLQPTSYDCYQKQPERQCSPYESRDNEPTRRPYRSKSRSASPYERREREYSRTRESSYEENRRRRSRSRSKPQRTKYSSSESSSSRSPSYLRSSKRDKKKRRSVSSNSSNASYKKIVPNRDEGSLTPPLRKKGSYSSKRPKSPPSERRSRSMTPRHKVDKTGSKSKSKHHSNKDLKVKDKRKRDGSTPPRKRSPTPNSPRSHKKSRRSPATPPRKCMTPPRKQKYKEQGSESSSKRVRDSSVTPPRSYARAQSASSGSRSRSVTPKAKRSRARTPKQRQSRSSSSQSSASSKKSDSKSKHQARRKASREKSRSKSRSKKRSGSKSRSRSRKRSKTPRKSKSRSRSSHRSGSASDDERRGQFTVADRKRFWKLHRSKQEKMESTKSPPKEVKCPPGAVEATTGVDDIQYGVPPEIEGPNFAELLPSVDQYMPQAPSTSKGKVLPIPIKNDGSFLEMFKKMQEDRKKAEEVVKKPEIKKPALPFIGKRRGGRVLKTGLVKKAKAIDEQAVDNTPKDAWSLYMQEVKKYRETSCEEERKTRPLVK